MALLLERNERGSGVRFLNALRRTAYPIWLLVTVTFNLFGIGCVAGGVGLAYRGATADTKFKLFGNEFTSTSVGVALVFIGGVILYLGLRRVLKSVECAVSGSEKPNPQATPDSFPTPNVEIKPMRYESAQEVPKFRAAQKTRLFRTKSDEGNEFPNADDRNA